jgi:hypothetical protein
MYVYILMSLNRRFHRFSLYKAEGLIFLIISLNSSSIGPKRRIHVIALDRKVYGQGFTALYIIMPLL